MEKLTELAVAVLALERARKPLSARLAAAERLGLSPWRYWQLVNFLIDEPEAARLDPETVAGLAALRERRAAPRRKRDLGGVSGPDL